MAKYPKFKYAFEINGEKFLLAVNEQRESSEGVLVRVHKYSKMPYGTADHFMHILCISLDGGAWITLEYGYRVRGGKFRDDFSKWRMAYPDAAGNAGMPVEKMQLYI